MNDRDDGLVETSRVLTIPNVISIVRLAGVPLFLWLVLGPQADGWALAVLALSGVSDYLDGYLARRLHQTSPLGQILDPVADRLYILATVLGLAWRDIIPWWLALLLPARDLFLWGLVPFLRTRGYSALPVHFLGKAATANLLYAFPLLLLGDGDGVVATLAQVFGWAFAIWGTAFQILEMVVHTAAAVDHGRLVAGEPTPVLTTHLALSLVAYPAFGITVIGWILATARDRLAGSRWIAWLGVLGAVAHGAAPPLVVGLDVPGARVLFPMVMLFALWCVLAAFWPRAAEAVSPARGSA